MKLIIAVEPLESREAQLLVSALDAYLSELYLPESNFLELGGDEVSDDRGIFLVARQDGVAVGCGAVRRVSESTAWPGRPPPGGLSQDNDIAGADIGLQHPVAVA